jgi:hypothetical protein
MLLVKGKSIMALGPRFSRGCLCQGTCEGNGEGMYNGVCISGHV